MADLLVRSQGAIAFEHHAMQSRGVSDATMFTGEDCIDQDWDAVVDRLREFRNLVDDWDGNDAVAPDDDLVDMAITLAARLKESLHPAPSRVLAGVNGTISFEFVGQPFFEIEIVSAVAAEVYENAKLIGTYTAN